MLTSRDIHECEVNGLREFSEVPRNFNIQLDKCCQMALLIIKLSSDEQVGFRLDPEVIYDTDQHNIDVGVNIHTFSATSGRLSAAQWITPCQSQ